MQVLPLASQLRIGRRSLWTGRTRLSGSTLPLSFAPPSSPSLPFASPPVASLRTATSTVASRALEEILFAGNDRLRRKHAPQPSGDAEHRHLVRSQLAPLSGRNHAFVKQRDADS